MTLVDADTGEIAGRSLTDCETVIQEGLGTIFAVGAALAEIQQNRLYRGQFATFEAYCRERWGWDRTYAHRVIEATKVRDLMLPIGNKTPSNEAQARAIAPLAKADPVAASKVLDGLAETGPVTAERIRDAVRDEMREPEPTPKLAAVPDGDKEDTAPTLGELHTFIPSSFGNLPEFRRSNASTRLGTMLDAKSVKDPERLGEMAAACPAEYRRHVAAQAEANAVAWQAFAQRILNPRRMEATS